MSFRIREAGESAVMLELEDRIDPEVNARAIWIGETIRAAAFHGVRDVVSSYRSVTVHFDPLRVDLDSLMGLMEQSGSTKPEGRPVDRQPMVVPVCYEGECAPDIADIAAFARCSAADVVRRHTDRVYRVFMLGFVPGFAYMGPVDERIAAPRRSAPRVRVPAGMVGIAGLQTGIYPSEAPGGWQLVGQTPLRPFDLARPTPCLFTPGDAVRFEAISLDDYQRQAASASPSS